jgi:UDP-N-acetyl-D-mannosaminuronate dehydrogenase
MNERKKVAVVGLGEIGKPLFELISKCHDAIGVDVEPIKNAEQVDIMHVCYPFQIKNFVDETARYINLFNPKLTIINSTVAVGTTRSVAKQTGAVVVHSPVRGKHIRMQDELRSYVKFVGAPDQAAGEEAARHFSSFGLKTKTLSSPEATELAKLTETTYFGLMIAWAQELERYCDQSGQNYSEIASFYEEIKFFPPVKYFPGIIGGHCVMPNIRILMNWTQSMILEAIEASNRKKAGRESRQEADHNATPVGVVPSR